MASEREVAGKHLSADDPLALGERLYARLAVLDPGVARIKAFPPELRAGPPRGSLSGGDLDGIIGKRVGDFVIPQDVAWIHQLLEESPTSAQQLIEFRRFHKDGSFRWLAWVAALAAARIYAMERHAALAKEAEEKLRAMEEALRHAQKVGTIGRFTVSVAHDFNNLLSVIQSSVTLLRVADLPEERRMRCLETLTVTTNQAIAVTKQLLEFASSRPLNPSVFSVAERVTALQDMLAMLCGSGIHIDAHLGDASLYTLADPVRFDSVLLNLATNARDAMEGKGSLRIGIRSASVAHASWPRRAQEGSFVAVSLTDTGPGIPEEHVGRIFEPFFTTKGAGQGIGVGLSQAVDFAEQSGGLVEVDSTVGAGATFTLYLPSVRAPMGEASR